MAEASVLKSTAQGTVLIVDDNVWIAKVWAKKLAEAGYRVEVAGSGQEALDALKNEPPHLVLLDIVMPGMDGYEVCSSVKNNPETKDIAIIFLTGIARPQERFRAEEAGAAGYLVKSDISPQILLEEVDRFFADNEALLVAAPAPTEEVPAGEMADAESLQEVPDSGDQAPAETQRKADADRVAKATEIEELEDEDEDLEDKDEEELEDEDEDLEDKDEEELEDEKVDEKTTSIAAQGKSAIEEATKTETTAKTEAPAPPPAAETNGGDAGNWQQRTERRRPRQRKELGAKLVDAGIITEQQLGEALTMQKTSGHYLGDTLVEMGILESGQIEQLLELAYEAPFVKLSEYILDPEAVGVVPKEVAQRFKVIPVKIEDGQLTVAMSNPKDLPAIDQLSYICKMDIQPVLANPQDIDDAIGKYYGMGVTLESAMEKVTEQDLTVVDDTENVLDESKLRELGEEAPVMQLVNMVIFKAVQERASDIHVQVDRDRVLVRYRIDGVLQDILTLPFQVHAATLSRIKVMANLDIAERRVPQDGRIDLKVGGDEIDLRVSTLPTLFGEKAVMRILNKSKGLIPLEQMGLSKDHLTVFEKMIKRPHGLILATGPTGSGKTTTLYAALKVINVPQKNIITVEDPVEYQLGRINQVPVNVKANLTFASALRSILRQDPDVVMVGEIRDLETARIAVQAALTGHLVLSSLHTNDASGAVNRMVDMGVEPFLVASSLTGVLAQRLARVTCTSCRQEYEASELEMSEHDLQSGAKLTRGKGCPKCRNTGYKGRTGVYEFLEVSKSIQRLIMKRADASQIKKVAVKEGMLTLRESAVSKMLSGNVSTEEVIRITAE